MLTYPDVTTIIPALRDGTQQPVNALVLSGAAANFTEAMDVGRYNEILAFLNITAHSGTPTLDVRFQTSPDKLKWTDLAVTFPQVSTTDSQQFIRISGFGKYIRAIFTLAGTSPSYTTTLTLIAKIGGGTTSSGGVYNSSTQTFVNGQSVPPQFDVNGNQLVSLGTLISGEDPTNNVLKVEQRFSYQRMTTAATLLVKSGAGFLHAIIVNTPVGSGVIELDDALTNTTPIIGKTTYPATLLSSGPATIIYDLSFVTGLSITTTGTMDITIVYR